MATAFTESVRVALYASFASRGRAPTVPELASILKATLTSIRSALASLHASHDLVLSSTALNSFSSDSTDADEDLHAVVMAHPFSSVPLGFSVMGKDCLWWGGCAWDSFALPHLIPSQAPVLVATRCRSCDAPLAFNVGTSSPSTDHPDAVAHFLVPTNRMWDDVVHTCGNQRIFCNEGCVDDWLKSTGNEKGYVMGMEQLWNFARGWYAGRMEEGYKRREPSKAKEYFKSVGLHGEFWGL